MEREGVGRMAGFWDGWEEDLLGGGAASLPQPPPWWFPEGVSFPDPLPPLPTNQGGDNKKKKKRKKKGKKRGKEPNQDKGPLILILINWLWC